MTHPGELSGRDASAEVRADTGLLLPCLYCAECMLLRIAVFGHQPLLMLRRLESQWHS